MFRNFPPRHRNRFPRPRAPQNNANNFIPCHNQSTGFPFHIANNNYQYQCLEGENRIVQIIRWDSLEPSPRMESDVEEGEIRESELLSPLSEDEEVLNQDAPVTPVIPPLTITTSPVRSRKRPARYMSHDHGETYKGRSIALNLGRGGGWVPASPRKAEIPPGRRRRSGPNRVVEEKEHQSPEQGSRSRWNSGELGGNSQTSKSSDIRVDNSHNLPNVTVRMNRNQGQESPLPSPRCGNSGAVLNVDVDQHEQSHSSRHFRARDRRARHGIPAHIQENHVIVFCDPPRSPDALQADECQPMQFLPVPIVHAEEIPHNDHEEPEEVRSVGSRVEDNEVEVLSIIDNATREAEIEMIVIDSTSSSDSESETDFEDPDGEPNKGALPPPRPPFVPPVPARVPCPVYSVDSPSQSPPVEINSPPVEINSPPLEFNSPPANNNEFQNELNDTHEDLSNEKTNQDNNHAQPNSPIVPLDDVDDEDLEVLELRIKALTGLMQKLPSSQPEEQEGVTPATTTNAEPNPILPDDSEKENENELELECLRSKLLSDLATQKKKKEAMDLLKQKQRTESKTQNSSSTSSSAPTRHTDRRNSKSYNSSSSSSARTRTSGRRKSSDVSSHTHSIKSNTRTSSKTSSSSRSHTHTRRNSSGSSARRTTTRKSSTSSTSKYTPTSNLLPDDMSSISISVSTDGRHRTVTSRENSKSTTTAKPKPKRDLSPIVVETDSQNRVVRILDPTLKTVKTITPPQTAISPSVPQPEPQLKSSAGGPKPKKAKMSSPQKVHQHIPIISASNRARTSGPQKVLTKPVTNIVHPPTIKMTPFSHTVAAAAVQPPNDFNITRTIANPIAFKGKYNTRKSYHNSINRTTRGGSRNVQPIVIQLRNNDESTEDEDTEEDEDDEDTSSATSANLPQEFHSSLEKFLKSVRESASKNGISGNPYLQNPDSAIPTPSDSNIQSTINVLPSAVSPVESAASSGQLSSEDAQKNQEGDISVIEILQPSPADNQSISINSPSSTTIDVDGKTQSLSLVPINSTGVQNEEISKISPCHSEDRFDGAKVSAASGPTMSPLKTMTPSPLCSPSTPSSSNGADSPIRIQSDLAQQQRPFTVPEMSTLLQVDQVLQRSLEQSPVKSKPGLVIKRPATTPPASRISPRKDVKSNATGESLADQFTRTREELQLREKLLRATFKKSETKIRLTRTEKDFLMSRKSATNLLGSAIDKINQHVEKKSQCSRMEQQVEKLRKQLEVAEKSLYFKTIEADALHEDAVTTISKAFDMRSKSVTFGIQCKKLGMELTGEQYKIPSTGAGDMLTKFKEIYKLTTKDELKKGPINFKKLEEQIITSLKGPNNKGGIEKTVSSSATVCPAPAAPSTTTTTRSNQQNVKNLPKLILEKGLGGIIVGGLTRHVLEPDMHIRNPCVNEKSHYFPNFLVSPNKNRVEIEFLESKFVPYVPLPWVHASSGGGILSTIDCNAVVCQNIVLSSCNSHNCKFQHLPESRSISNDRKEKDGL